MIESSRLVLSHIGERRYARFERLRREAHVVHAFSTRPIDVSARTDANMLVRHARRRQMALDLGLDAARLCYTVQAHETRVGIIDEDVLRRMSYTRKDASDDLGLRFEDCDALVTNVPGVPLMTFSADCPLVLVFDPRRRVVGMVHSSWRCTVAFSTRQLVETMCERFGCKTNGLLAGIGPSAGPQMYEVKRDVYDAAANLPGCERLFPRRDGRMFFDLWEANRAQLVASGIPSENIEIAGVCTMTDRELFYSFRREGPGCGHFGLMAGLAPS